MSAQYRLRSLAAPVLVLVACASSAEPGTGVDDDIADAVARLPSAEVEASRDGVPTFVSGDLGRAADGKLDAGKADAALSSVMAAVAPVFRLRASDFRLLGATADAGGAVHARFRQLQFGFDVEGAELLVHVDATGVVYAANGTARGGATPSMKTGVTADEAARGLLAQTRYRGMSAGTARLGFLQGDSRPRLTWELTVSGTRDGEPVEDRVFVDAHSGAIAATHPQVHAARQRRITTVNNGQVLPGITRLDEGGERPSDPHLGQLYDHIGISYDCYQALFARDSWDGKGGQIIGVAHYGVNTQNAYWRGNGFVVFGDGDGKNSGPFGRALDIVAHELTHGVTRATAALVYENESGALNEAMSDVFGAVCESWSRNGTIDELTWKIGEDMETPGTPGDALRYMNDPAADGMSRDFYPDRYVGTWDNGGVHVNSGIANLAFKLLVTGGKHPRGKSTVQVPALGMEKARKIFYRTLTTYLTSTSEFVDLRGSAMFAANELYGAAERQAVEKAFTAVGVDDKGMAGAAPTALTAGAEATVSDKLYGQKVFAIEVPPGTAQLVVETRGGTGDADLYLKHGARPTTYRHELASTNLASSREVITVTDPKPGRMFVLVAAAAEYGDVKLSARTSAASALALEGGLWHTVSGQKGAARHFTVEVPAGAVAATFELEGSEGDANLYVRRGAAASVATHEASSATAGTSKELVTVEPQSGTYHILVDGAGDFPSATLRATILTATGIASGDTRALAGTTGTPALFTLDVPAGARALEVRLSGGTGDADVYVQAGSPPTDKQHEHGSFGPTTEELVLASGLVPGLHYIAVYGSGAYSGVELSVRLHEGEVPAIALANERSVNVGLAAGGAGRFTLEVPPTALDGTLALSGTEADVFVKRGAPASATSFDYTGKKIEVAPLPPGVYHVLVQAKTTGSSWLGATYQATPLMRDTRGYIVSGTVGSTKVWKVEVPEGSRGVRVQMTGTDGDADLYLKKGAAPTKDDHEVKSENSHCNETVNATGGPGAYYILVSGFAEYSLAELKATIEK